MEKQEQKVYLYWATFLLLLLFITSCNPYKPVVVTEKVTQTITEVVHDTIIQIEKDSSSYKALLDCESHKITVNKILSDKKGKHLQKPKVSIKDNVLTVDCEVYAQEVLARWRSKNKTIIKTIEKPVYIERELGFFKKLQIYLGRLFIILLLLWLAYKSIKKKLRL